MTKRQKIAVTIMVTFGMVVSIIIFTASVYSIGHDKGREEGREEAIQMIKNELTDRYTFGEVVDRSTGWEMGSFGGTANFEGNKKMLFYNYLEDDGIIKVSLRDVK